MQAFTSQPSVDVSAIPLDKIDVSQHHLYETGEALALFARLRREDPVHYCASSAFGPYWSVTRHEDIMHVDTNPAIFSSSYKHGGTSIDDTLGREEGFENKSFIMLDPPEHGLYRKAVQPIVSVKSLDNMRALIQERTCRVLDSLPANEPFNWVDRVSIELTTLMMATLFDVPIEDRHKLREWSDATGALEGSEDFVSREDRMAKLMGCLQYFMKLFQERAQLPPKFDLISMLAHDPNSRALGPVDLLGTILLLIVGANDTTRNSMSASVYCSHLFPNQFEMVKKDPQLIENMIKEIIRWQSPICHQRRTTTQDTELGGKIIKKGEKVVMWYLSGNRDETVFANPDEIDLKRDNLNRHLAFGFGIHRCMGMRVAELQLRILWQEILARYERMEVIGVPRRLRSNQMNAYTDMTVRLVPKAR